MSPRIPIAASASARRLTWAETRIRTLQKRGPGEWVYVGTYPTDNFTTYWSPPWENSYTFTAGRQVRFRHGIDANLEIEGQFDLTDGPISGDVAFTLPDDWRGDYAEAFIPLELDDGVWSAAVITVNGLTGEVILYWPVVADPIP